MRQVKISRYLASAVVCSLLLAAGCAPTGKEAVKPATVKPEAAKPEVKVEKQIPKAKTGKVATIALKFTPGDLTVYKTITEAERSIKWDGNVPDEPAFKGGRNHDMHEMTFAQEIQSVDDKGNAVAKITIKSLKYSSIVKDIPVLEFDSAKPKDPNHPLAMLIGQSYTIKIAPTGEVIEVIDTKEVEIAARKGSVPPGAALRMLSDEAIKDRHGTLRLPDTDKDQLPIGDHWSITRTFPFGMMGSESYEKIYTLNSIKDQDNQQIAIIGMDAIPASEVPKEQAAKFSKNSDKAKTYTGELELNLTAGKVKKYNEKLQQEWTTAFPTNEQQTSQEPAILTMSAARSYSIEKID